MKNLKKFLLLSSFVSLLASPAIAAENEYAIEPTHTSITWIANHFGFSNPSGKFADIAGKIVFDEKNPKASSVDVTINTASINTGLVKFDEHLKSGDFFDVKSFPKARFVSKKVAVTGKNTAKITGDLTLIKTTKPVILDVTFNKADINPINQKQTIGFSATAIIKRSEFGINYAIPGVADEVKLMIEVEANK